MAKKKNNNFIWIVVIVIAFFAFSKGGNFLGAITGSETMTRTAPSQVNPGESFQVTYTVSGGTPPWGASIVDSATGGCTFPGGTSDYKSVMLSEDGDSKIITITAPDSGQCVFHGDYKFGDFDITAFFDLTVNICTPLCTRPVDLCIDASTVSDGCGGFCTGQWTVEKLLNIDTDCSNSIDRSELGVGINQWLAGTLSRNDLGIAIQSWASGG